MDNLKVTSKRGRIVLVSVLMILLIVILIIKFVSADCSDYSSTLFCEDFNTDPGSGTNWWYYGFDGGRFSQSSSGPFWDKTHMPSEGIGGSGTLRVTSTFDSDEVTTGLDKVFPTDLRDFWVGQCWKFADGWPGTEDMKLNYWHTSTPAQGFIEWATSSQNGVFQDTETIVGQTSGASADIFSFYTYDSTSGARSVNIVGDFVVGETIVGQQSGATAIFGVFIYEERTVIQNHFWHNGGGTYWAGGGAELAWYSITHDWIGANFPLNSVQHTNYLYLHEHYDEWICLDTHFDVDQNPWDISVYVTTEWGAQNLAAGNTGTDSSGIQHFNDYLYISFIGSVPGLLPGNGFTSNQYGSYVNHMVTTGNQMFLDEYVLSYSKTGPPLGLGGSSSVCGDASCNGGETCLTCESDCGVCTNFCGDGTCDTNENCTSCESDCGICPFVCGDASCNGGETCLTCESDCGVCSGTGCDADNDGYNSNNVTCGANDCNDNNPLINPLAQEICDGVDNNCVAGIDEGCEEPCPNPHEADTDTTCCGVDSGELDTYINRWLADSTDVTIEQAASAIDAWSTGSC